MYDPTMGRFLQEDPIGLKGGDANFYRYCRNDPINATDPSGCGPVYGNVDPNNPSWLLPDNPLYPGVPNFIEKWLPHPSVPPEPGPPPFWLPYNPNDGGRDPTPTIPSGTFHFDLGKGWKLDIGIEVVPKKYFDSKSYLDPCWNIGGRFERRW